MDYRIAIKRSTRSRCVTYAVIKARDIETMHNFKIENEKISELVKEYPDMFIGLAGVDPYKGQKAVDELEYAVKNLGLVGLNLWTFEYEMYPNDKRLYPLYEKCVELGIFVSIQSSMHFSQKAYMDLCRPLYLDYVAVDFPDLKIVGSTPGWPWVAELVAVAWRHPNVFHSDFHYTTEVYDEKWNGGMNLCCNWAIVFCKIKSYTALVFHCYQFIGQ